MTRFVKGLIRQVINQAKVHDLFPTANEQTRYKHKT